MQDPEEVKATDMVNRRGSQPLLGATLDSVVQEHIQAHRDAGGVVNRPIVLSTAYGIIQHRDRSLLKEFGGHVELTRGWSQSLMHRMGYVKRKGTQAAHKLPDDFPAQKRNFLQMITNSVNTHGIPAELVINFDQTGVAIVPVSNWTLNKAGAKQVLNFLSIVILLEFDY